MTKKQIDAILWRSYLAATSSTLWELSKSQYYIELSPAEPDYVEFFGGYTEKSQDPQGNEAFVIRLEPFQGESPVDGYDLKLVRLRDGTARAGKWQVLGQRGKTAYPLWQKNRGPLQPFQKMKPGERGRDFLIIVRDIAGAHHGRWLQGKDIDSLPAKIKKLLTSKNVGWSKL